jgi:hypothetical protein
MSVIEVPVEDGKISLPKPFSLKKKVRVSTIEDDVIELNPLEKRELTQTLLNTQDEGFASQKSVEKVFTFWKEYFSAKACK